MNKSFDEIISEKARAYRKETGTLFSYDAFVAGSQAAVEALGVTSERQMEIIRSAAAAFVVRNNGARVTPMDCMEQYELGAIKGLELGRAESQARIAELEDKLYHASREAPAVEYELNQKLTTLEAQNAELKEKLDEAIGVIRTAVGYEPFQGLEPHKCSEFLSRLDRSKDE